MHGTNWMVSFQRQTEWIDGEGALIWLADLLTVIGAGGFLAGMFYQELAVMFICYLLIAAASVGHLFHCRYPSRVIRMLSMVKKSWMSRGMLISILFTICGFLQLAAQILLTVSFDGWDFAHNIREIIIAAPFFVKLLPVLVRLCQPVDFILCAGLLLYEGLMLNRLRSIQIFNNALLPLILAELGLLFGFGAVSFFFLLKERPLDVIRHDYYLLLILTALSLLLFALNALYSGSAAEDSVKRMTRGVFGICNGLGTVVMGLAVPAALLSFGGMPMVLRALLFGIGGISAPVFFMYTLFKSAVYNPMV